ncbi:hypothetical protein ACHAWU_007858 [Discostella pseudostelligera]|uniref:Hexosyltransferase n=1 Tax=Discostella pseudostelligera TaxID=259834 RepID=A0ABD3MF52_9STRA
MKQKSISYAAMAGLLFILLYTTAMIRFATFSSPRNDVDIDAPPLHRDRRVIDTDAASNDAHHPPSMILPINQRKLDSSHGNTGPGGVRDVLPGLLSLSSQARKIDETGLPYPCGAILYVHLIPGEAGDALNEWIAQLVESNEGASLISSEEHTSKQVFINEVVTNISTIGRKEWIIINSHTTNGLSFSNDKEIMHYWMSILERQQCKFVAAAIFSDPLDHSIKHTKRRYAECNDCENEEFEESIMDELSTSNPWMGQLDHFLYNRNDKSTSAVVTKDKVKSAIQLLINHFDLVLVDGKGNAISDALLKITGWTSRSRPRKATVANDDEGPNYSKNLVNAYIKMSTKNGDADFIDAVNHVYYNSLVYLMLQ